MPKENSQRVSNTKRVLRNNRLRPGTYKDNVSANPFSYAPQPDPPIDNLRAVIIIRGDPAGELSPNNFGFTKGSGMKRMRLVKFWVEEAGKVWRHCGSPRFDIPVTIEFSIRRRRVLDPDNALAGLKSLVDGFTSRRLGEPGLIPDDSSKWVSYLPVAQVTGAKFAMDPHIVMTVLPREEEK